MSSFSLMQFLFAPIWGRISDRRGRRPILLLGLSGSVAFYALFGYASNLPADSAASAKLALALILLARIGAGIAGATISTAQAVIADCTTPERRKHGMALIGAAFGIGFTFGPLLGFAARTWDPDQPGLVGYIAAALSLTALVLGLLLLPETRRFGAAPATRKWFDWQATVNTLRNPRVGPVVLVFFAATLGFGGFESTLALLNHDALGLEDNANFLVFSFVGLVLMLTQGLLYRRLANRVSEPTFMVVGIALMGLGVLALAGITWFGVTWSIRLASGAALGAVVPALPAEMRPVPGFGSLLIALMTCLTFAVVGFALLTPSAQALISRRSDPEKQGEILGVNQSASALARILGPGIALNLYFLTDTHLLPFFFGASLLLVMLPLMPRVRRGD